MSVLYVPRLATESSSFAEKVGEALANKSPLRKIHTRRVTISSAAVHTCIYDVSSFIVGPYTQFQGLSQRIVYIRTTVFANLAEFSTTIYPLCRASNDQQLPCMMSVRIPSMWIENMLYICLAETIARQCVYVKTIRCTFSSVFSGFALCARWSICLFVYKFFSYVSFIYLVKK